MTDLISKHGGYRDLQSYRMSEIVFDLTFEFVKLYISPKSRTQDQMEQAARSGKQNIAEGSVTSGSSKQSELRLLAVARASLQELLEDCNDFLRIHHLPLWSKDSPRVIEIRKLAYVSNKSYRTYMAYMSEPETAANCLVCVINQANYLLDQQVRSLERELKTSGDFKDRYKEIRKRQILNQDDDYDEFLKSQGLRRLENGRVVGINDPDQ